MLRLDTRKPSRLRDKIKNINLKLFIKRIIKHAYNIFNVIKSNQTTNQPTNQTTNQATNQTTNFQPLRYQRLKLQIKRGSTLLASLVLIALLSPILKKTFTPQITNAATVTRTWQLKQSSTDTYSFNTHEIEQTSTGTRLKQLPSSVTLTAEEESFSDVWEQHHRDPAPSIDNKTIVDDPSSGGNNKVYNIAGSSWVGSKFRVPINPDFSYTLSGRFKSVGTSGQQSRLFFGFQPMTGDSYNPIRRHEYLIKGDTATIASFNDSTITVQAGADLTTWADSSTYNNRRLIGFYLDGQTDHLPDHVMMVNTDIVTALSTDGAYSSASGTTINLNGPIPPEVQARIVPGTTKVRNQTNTGVGEFLYFASAGDYIPTSGYTTYSGAITGTNFAQASSHIRFPLNTKWAQIALIANLQQNNTYATNFDDITLTVTGSQPMYSWQTPPITAQESQRFSSRVLSIGHTLDTGSQGNVKYQVSVDDGKTWQYYNTVTSAWEEATNPSNITQSTTLDYVYSELRLRDFGSIKANDISILNTNLPTLTATGGKFKWRAFLESNGTQPVELQSVTITAENSTPTIVSVTPSIGQTSGGDRVTIRGSNFQEPTFSDLSSGGAHNCALTADNQVYCWGRNHVGQLGNGTLTDSSVPIPIDSSGVLAGKTITRLALGYNSSCVIADGQVYCWGRNDFGQLGDGTTDDRLVPVAVNTSGALNGKTITQVSSGGFHTCALDSEHKTYCWGKNEYGQLGDGTTDDRLKPVAVDTSGALAYKPIEQISAGYHYTCALANSQVYCWGANTYGQLGDGTTYFRSTPTPIVQGDMPALNIKQLFASLYHNCVIARDDKVYCWGWNAMYGQVGDGSGSNRSVPTAVAQGDIPADIRIAKIFSGQAHNSFAIDANGNVYGWGKNFSGQLGDGTTTHQPIPVLTQRGSVPTGVSIEKITTGEFSTCFLGSNEKVYCQGDSVFGSLGNGKSGGANNSYDSGIDSLTAIPIIALPTVKFDNVTATPVRYASPYTIEVNTPAHAAGAVSVTVANLTGESATKTNAYTYEDPAVPQINSISPSSGLIYGGEEVTINGTNLHKFKWKQVSSGDNHTCAIGLDRKAYCWGSGGVGRLGNGTTTDSSTPVAVLSGAIPAGVTLTQISAGGFHTCALGSDGKAYCWGATVLVN